MNTAALSGHCHRHHRPHHSRGAYYNDDLHSLDCRTRHWGSGGVVVDAQAQVVSSPMSRHGYYILQDRNPVPVDTVTWAVWFEHHRADRLVQQDHLGDYWISTVFIGLNYNDFEGPPVIFETMVFKESQDEDLYCERYATWELALEGHRRVARLVKLGQLPPMDDDHED